jgi:hypothetical protein
MLIPKFILEDLSVGSGSIIGKSNIEEFFNHTRKNGAAARRALTNVWKSYIIDPSNVVV